MNVIYYLQHVAHERPDVTLIDKEVLRSPYYLDYLERQYPATVQAVPAFAQYKTLLQQWIDTGHASRQLPNVYTALLNGLIDTNLGQRPVYIVFFVPARDTQAQREAEAVLAPHRDRLVPDGFGYRVAADPSDHQTGDPHFDLRGVTEQPVARDEVAASLVAQYPTLISAVGAYLAANSTTSADRDTATRLLKQAADLQYLLPLGDERPRVR